MSILNKLMDTMRLTENDDDYFDEEDYEEEKPVIKKRSFGKRDEEMDDYRHEEESMPPSSPLTGGQPHPFVSHKEFYFRIAIFANSTFASCASRPISYSGFRKIR